MKIDFDVDIDMANRDELLKFIEHIPASIKREDSFDKHNTGVYLQPIPHFPLEGFSTIDHKEAEELGYFKIDVLNNHVYESVESEAIIPSGNNFWVLGIEKDMLTISLSEVSKLKGSVKIDETNFNYKEIESLFFFKSGRWDIETKSGILIKFPKRNLERSIELVVDILNENIQTKIYKIDIRLNDQVIIDER